MPVDEVALNEALDDVCGEILMGRGDMPTIVHEVAADYNLNQELVARKFKEKFGSVLEVIERQDVLAAKKPDPKLLRLIIDIVCRRHRLGQDKFYPLEGRTKVFIAKAQRRGKQVNLYLDYGACRIIAEEDV